MSWKSLFSPDKTRCFKKREAFQKILAKLDQTRNRLEEELRSSYGPVKIKNVEIRLRTNGQHREKAEMLIAELDRTNAGDGWLSRVLGR